MSKLAEDDRFLDFSDFGRPIARILVKRLINSNVTAIHYTFIFGLCGLIAASFIYTGMNKAAGIFLILKSIFDAADGEVARLKKSPSYVGRYLDSIFDIILNVILIFVIGLLSQSGWFLALNAFLLIQIQGTLYNYYYVILRNKLVGGDTTSKIFEKKSPTAFEGESQRNVNVLYHLYLVLYGAFDRIIYTLDNNAHKAERLPNWFMTILSFYGLGFQLLMMAIFLWFNRIEFIIPYFLFSSIMIPVLILTRKAVL